MHAQVTQTLPVSLGHRSRLKKGSCALPGALPLLSIPLLVTDYSCTWFHGTQRLHVSAQEAQETESGATPGT